jgi:hypothetical protein
MYKRKMFGIGITLLMCAAPQLSAGVAGCNNGYLLGNYNAQVSNLNLQNTLQVLNGNGAAVTPATGSGTTVVGFSNNPRSLAGAALGSSRFYFDGAGTIVGLATPSGGTVAVPTQAGTYSVGTDCTATITLNGGASFDAVVADQGHSVLFVETDSSNVGAVGTLQRASSCVSFSYPQSFAFTFFGATPVSASGTSGSGGSTGSTGGTSGGTGGTSGSTGTGGTSGVTGTGGTSGSTGTGGTSGSTGTGGTSGSTGTSGTSGSTGTSGTSGSTGTSGTSGSTGTSGQAGGTNGLSFGAFSQIGTISTDGAGNFSITQTSISNGQVTRSRGGGTYSVDANCSLRLSFTSNFPGTTANFVAPTSISGLTTDSQGGVLVEQPNSSTSTMTGTFIVQ